MIFSIRHNEISARPRTAAGFTLVELMISLVLGLLVVAGVGSVFIANQSAYRSNVALGEVQESARTSFEFLAREIRSAGGNPCGTTSVGSVLNNAGDQMLDDYTAIEGWDDATAIVPTQGSGGGEPVANESAIRLAGAKDSRLVLNATTTPRTTVELDGTTSQIKKNDIAMLCDVNKATIFQVTSDPSSSSTLGHDDTGTSPGNQTECLNHPIPQAAGSDCNSFSPSSYLAIPTSYIWYVGENSAGGRSLFRYGRGKDRNSVASEMVRGVWAMTVSYHEGGGSSYVAASGVGDWEDVDAARLELTVRSLGVGPDGRGVGTDNQPLERVFTTTVALRNQLNNN